MKALMSMQNGMATLQEGQATMIDLMRKGYEELLEDLNGEYHLLTTPAFTYKHKLL